jgi:hypothetical protein
MYGLKPVPTNPYRSAKAATESVPQGLKCEAFDRGWGGRLLGVLSGKKVSYLGRKGESHMEEFPRAKD